ncbi:unnamed protein product [Soboliphyme baturini]|uniref:Integron gene cassette protein n=1 Tax=Soboliphyme baturini TaxID=241478 RepID=A0A183IV89_9BILA|nr:unnamed protein product [Soboliphyme baturini]
MPITAHSTANRSGEHCRETSRRPISLQLIDPGCHSDTHPVVLLGGMCFAGLLIACTKVIYRRGELHPELNLGAT